MIWKAFEHPDFCPAVFRRRVGEEVLDTMNWLAHAMRYPGKAFWSGYYPNDSAYRNAIARLRREGLIAYRRSGGKSPVLRLTSAGEEKVSAWYKTRKPWPNTWNGTWYLLTYDVPEAERPYRNVLRLFLSRLRMGCLQRSVWITSTDIRPDFDDLVKAGGLNEYAFLFESKSVLGRSPHEIVQTAWDMDGLHQLQSWYLEVFEENLCRITSTQWSSPELAELIREENAAYSTAMHRDPLLPRDLWPDDYAGERVWQFHQEFARQIAHVLES